MSIATEITRLQTAKSDLKTAIEGKGVTVPPTATLDGYADLVDTISGGGGNITVTPLSVTENGTYTAGTGSAYSPVTVNVGQSADVEIKTVSVTISNTKALFNALVPSTEANKTYVVSEYEFQDQTLYNMINFMLVHTGASGEMLSPTVGIRYRNGVYNTCGVATNYDAAATIGDRYSVRCY